MNIEKTPQSNIDSEKKHSGDKTVEVLESNIEKTIKDIDDTEGLQQPQQSEAKNSENTESEQQIKKSLDTVSDLGVVKVYDRLGKFVFSGNPDQLMIFWKNKDYGTVEDIGGISDEEGKSIFRFGPTDGHGFTDRKCIENLFQKLEGDVMNKKRIAENAQKLIELHEQLGIKQEIPVAPQVEQPTETITEQSKKTESQVENPLHRENLFDSKKAKKISDIDPKYFEQYEKADTYYHFRRYIVYLPCSRRHRWRRHVHHRAS